MSVPTALYTTNHIHSNVVMDAARRGLPGATLRTAAEWVPEPCLVYGILRGTSDIIRRNIAAGLDWWHIDHGYFCRGHYGGYYRLSKNGFTANPRDFDVDADRKRFDSLGVVLKDREGGSAYGPIVVCPPTEYWCKFNPVWSLDYRQWIEAVATRLRKITSRPVVVKTKNDDGVEWDSVYAVVAHSSNILVEAMVEGISAVATCGDHPLRGQLTDIGWKPTRPNRLVIARNLANNQFTLDEFAEGLPWQNRS